MNNDSEESEIEEYHRFIVNSDLYQTYTLTQHTWKPVNIDSESNVNSKIESEIEVDVNSKNTVVDSTLVSQNFESSNSPISIKLRIMTYNIWHNNPPAWLLHDK